MIGLMEGVVTPGLKWSRTVHIFDLNPYWASSTSEDDSTTSHLLLFLIIIVRRSKRTYINMAFLIV
jgi:hypothetical protein